MQRYMFCNHIVLNATVNVLISYCDECKGKCVNIILWWMQRQRFCYHAEYNGKFIVESASLHSLHASVTGSVFFMRRFRMFLNSCSDKKKRQGSLCKSEEREYVTPPSWNRCEKICAYAKQFLLLFLKETDNSFSRYSQPIF